jgi:hypothetical protein
MHTYWWTAIPALPSRRDTLAYRRLMRVFGDHTIGPAQSAYSATSERHLVASFFENFALDKEYRWIQRLALRLNMLCGTIHNAAWSYEYEDQLAISKRNGGPGIADVVVSWRDDAGDAVVVIEAKKPGGVRSVGLNDKDDPRRGAYLRYAKMQSISRRQQMLLVGHRDLARLPRELSKEPHVITWEELAAIQHECLIPYASERAAVFGACLQDHHSRLGLTVAPRMCANTIAAINKNDPSVDITQWLASYLSYVNFTDQGESNPPFEWLRAEQGQDMIRAACKQTTAERERALWRI